MNPSSYQHSYPPSSPIRQQQQYYPAAGTPPPPQPQPMGSPRMPANSSSSPHPRAMTPGRTPSPMSGGGGGGGSSHNYNQSQGRGYQQQQHNQYQRSNNNNNSFYNKSGAGGNASATDLAQALLPPGSAALLDLIDKRVLVLLRDGRLLVGILRSYDHFANLVFQDTVERIAAGDVFGDIDRGVFVVRGENVVMLGEVDGDVEDALPMREVPVEEALAMQRVELDIRRAKEAVEHPALHRGGFCVDFDPNDMY